MSVVRLRVGCLDASTQHSRMPWNVCKISASRRKLIWVMSVERKFACGTEWWAKYATSAHGSVGGW